LALDTVHNPKERIVGSNQQLMLEALSERLNRYASRG